MKVPARIFASKKLLEQMDEGVIDQITNVAQLQGLVGYVLALPDAHWGYGCPIGGVFATDPINEGVISPGSVGFDINCGVRLLTTNLKEEEVKPHLNRLIDCLFARIPSGVGQGGFLKLNEQELQEVMIGGAEWAVKRGFGWEEDLDHIEENGKMPSANPDKISKRAIQRGKSQVGTLGSGNHYLEIQKVDEIFDSRSAFEMGVKEAGQIVIMIHCGSRGFGHQVATDYLEIFEEKMPKYKISVPDPQLAAVPFDSPEGQDYFMAMAAAANLAFANRQVITQQVRNVFSQLFRNSTKETEINLVYDVAHNIAKKESHEIGGRRQELIVHRKGATRSFPGQPVLIGGSMETKSHLMVGTDEAMRLSFGSTAHGAGRKMSRAEAKRGTRGERLQKEMQQQGIYIRTSSTAGLAEEAGIAYKDVDEVVETVQKIGISKKVASLLLSEISKGNQLTEGYELTNRHRTS